MPTCPFWRASMKGVTPQLSLLSGWYWHLGEEEKPGQSRWQLQNPHGRRPSAAGLNMEYIKPIHRPWINLSWCFRAWGMICGGGFLGSEIWFSSFGLYRSFVIPFFPDQRVSRRDKVCTGSREYYSTIPDPHGMMYKIKSPQISFRLNSSEN